jgi:hypothetical protein
VDYAVWGGRDVFGFHATNVVLHGVNVVLLFILVRRLVRDTAPIVDESGIGPADATAFLTAALFAVHPMMTEAVSYVSSRSDLLATGLFLSALHCFRRAFDGGLRWLAGGVMCFLLALGSKETAAMLPFVLLASDLLLDSGSDRRNRFWRIHAPLLSVVVLAGAARSWFYVTFEHPEAGGFLTWGNVAVQAHVVIRYLSLLIVPLSQTIVPSVSPIVSILNLRLIVTVVSLAGITVLAFRAHKRTPLVTFGLVWFALALVPSSVLSLLARTGQPMAEHRAYLASCGFFMAVSAFLSQLTYSHFQQGRSHASRLAAAGVVLTVLLALLALTVARNRVWADPVRLWEDAARQAPLTFAAQAGLGYVQWAAGNCDAAATAYNRAMSLRPNEADPYIALADCFIRRSRKDDAAAILRVGTSRAPADVKIRLMLAALEEGRPAGTSEALRLCREALAIEPGSVAAQECVRRNTYN